LTGFGIKVQIRRFADDQEILLLAKHWEIFLQISTKFVP
jgi:hypothetical protein